MRVNWIEDDSSVIDAIESAKAAWFEAHPECNEPATEVTDEYINEALELPVSGAIRPLADEFADWTENDIGSAVTAGLDRWFAQKTGDLICCGEAAMTLETPEPVERVPNAVHARDVAAGKRYRMRLDGEEVTVRVMRLDRTSPPWSRARRTHYVCLNEKTGGEIRVKAASKFLREVTE